jgi:hypothetical protein
MKREGEKQTEKTTQENFCLLVFPVRADINTYTASSV